MGEEQRRIRIVIREPEPGWWARVKEAASQSGCFVSTYVVRAVWRELMREGPSTPLRYAVPGEGSPKEGGNNES